MVKIDELTAEEQALIPIIRNEWLEIALATGLAEREAAQAAISDAYRAAGLAPPCDWIWLGNPCAGHIATVILYELMRDRGEALCSDRRIGQPVSHQIRYVAAQVQNQVKVQIADPIRDQIKDQVGGQVDRQIALIRRLIACHVDQQSHEQAMNQDWYEVLAQAEDPVWQQLWNRASSRAWGVVEARIWAADGYHDDYGYDAFYGQHDAGWLSDFDFFRRLKRIEGPERLEPLIRVARYAGWWWPFERVCIVTERPSLLVRDAEHRLHSTDGPALRYPDGWVMDATLGILPSGWS